MRRISLSRHPIEEQSEKYWIEGDLRLMVKTNPVAFVIAQAAGAASGGRQRILDLQPAALHRRVGLVIGSKNKVERITAYHRQGT